MRSFKVGGRSLENHTKELEQLLTDKISLLSRPKSSWVLRLADVTGGPEYLDEEGSWKELVLYSKLRFISALAIGIMITILLMVAFALFYIRLPTWLFIAAILLTYLLAHAWLERRRKRKSSRKG